MTIALSEIAEHLDAEVFGKANIQIRGMASLWDAEGEDLSLCHGRRWVDGLRQTKAGAVLLASRESDLLKQAPCTVLYVQDVRVAMAKALNLLFPSSRPEPGISPQAVVEPGAEVSPLATVAPFVHICAGAKIGDHCWLKSGVYVGPGAQIGNDCIIDSQATIHGCCRLGNRVVIGSATVLGSDGFGFFSQSDGLRRIPQIGSVVIDDDVELGANCCVDRGTLGATRIGRGSKLDNLVQVAHNVNIGNNVCIAAQTGLSGSVIVEDGALLAGQVGVADHVVIGSNAEVGAKSGVGSNIAADSRVVGYPALPVREWLDGVYLWRRMRKALRRLENKD